MQRHHDNVETLWGDTKILEVFWRYYEPGAFLPKQWSPTFYISESSSLAGFFSPHLSEFYRPVSPRFCHWDGPGDNFGWSSWMKHRNATIDRGQICYFVVSLETHLGVMDVSQWYSLFISIYLLIFINLGQSEYGVWLHLAECSLKHDLNTFWYNNTNEIHNHG